MKEPILIHPNFQEKFSIFTDASEEATGGVLAQELKGLFKPVKYTIKLFSGPELQWGGLSRVWMYKYSDYHHHT
ncbi:hypothetical protein DSO57_1030866 [Entomophthora muscae]|uniref:Uncharacterized protein n=1 Tax=Entomophthora muscae TaxID=34485 RepID=A0ACC2T100_9FUNG|nr:hypothetical protein DSO57_1030866 [Entomophthora muscae]